MTSAIKRVVAILTTLTTDVCAGVCADQDDDPPGAGARVEGGERGAPAAC